MKKVLILVCFLLAFASVLTFAASDVRVSYNDSLLDLYPKARIIDGRTLVPVRGVLEEAGIAVGWEQETQTVSLRDGENIVKISIDDKIMHKNGNKFELDVPPMLIGNTTYVPLRAIMEAFGIDVGWEQESKTVLLNKVDMNVPELSVMLAKTDIMRKLNKVKIQLLMKDVNEKITEYEIKSDMYGHHMGEDITFHVAQLDQLNTENINEYALVYTDKIENYPEGSLMIVDKETYFEGMDKGDDYRVIKFGENFNPVNEILEQLLKDSEIDRKNNAYTIKESDVVKVTDSIGISVKSGSVLYDRYYNLYNISLVGKIGIRVTKDDIIQFEYNLDADLIR